MAKSDFDMFEKQAIALLGLKQQSMGKSLARQNLLPLINDLAKSAKAIEITDHDQPVAVLISYVHWRSIMAKLAHFSHEVSSKKVDLMGSIEIIGDLEEGSKEIARKFKRAIEKSGKVLLGK